MASMRAAHGREAFGARLRHGKSGGGEAHSEDAHDGGAHDSREALAAARGIGAGHPAGLVGGGAERNINRPAGDQVAHFGAIARGVHAAQVGLHTFVGADGAGAADLHSGFGGQFHVGPEAGREHHHIQAHQRGARWRIDAHAAAQLHAVLLQLLADRGGELRVVAQQRVRRTLQHGDAQPVAAQRVGRLQPDIAGADDHRRAAVACFAQEGAQAGGIVQRVEGEDVRLAAPARPQVSQRAPVAITRRS